MKFALVPVATVLLVLAGSLPAEGQRKLFPFAQRQSQEQKVSELDEKAGPWLVMCASFVGESAQVDAELLCDELASNGFRTYTFQKSFDYSGTYQGVFHSEHENEADRDSSGQTIPRPQRMKARTSGIEEVAVLVGDFPNVEDQRAQKALQQIKTLQIRSLSSVAHDSLMEATQTNPDIVHADRKSGGGPSQKGLLGAAFLIANPVLPDEYFATQQVDKEILSLNRDYRFSLLDNPGTYSVRVATFRGDSTFESSSIKNQEDDQKWGARNKKAQNRDKLAEAGLKADVLTKFLRARGIEAWVFHDRFESYVCVGSFDWISREGNLGQDEYNPDVVAVVDEYRGSMGNAFSRGNVLQPKSLAELKGKGIAFDIQPMPVMVPRANNDRRTAFGQ